MYFMWKIWNIPKNVHYQTEKISLCLKKKKKLFSFLFFFLFSGWEFFVWDSFLYSLSIILSRLHGITFCIFLQSLIKLMGFDPFSFLKILKTRVIIQLGDLNYEIRLYNILLIIFWWYTTNRHRMIMIIFPCYVRNFTVIQSGVKSTAFGGIKVIYIRYIRFGLSEWLRIQ